MGTFTRSNCVSCSLFWGTLILMFSEISAHAADLNPPAFQEENRDFVPLRLSASFPEQLEITDHCRDLLQDFGQRYSSLATCLVSNARPVKVCQDCYSAHNSFQEIYTNISTGMGPGNVSCQDPLLRADRLMLLYNLYRSIEHIWQSAECIKCLDKDQKSVSNATLYFMDQLNQSLTCFEKYQQGNLSDLCTECKTLYKMLNVLYSTYKSKNQTCIDLEDAMNVTQRLWSKTFNCSLKREENVPVIAVSSFMLFLPIIFYLSNYLHSEQKKRKLIHPKRAKSSHSLMNIQDKYN